MALPAVEFVLLSIEVLPVLFVADVPFTDVDVLFLDVELDPVLEFYVIF